MSLGPKEMGNAILNNLEKKTGKNIDAWIKILKKAGLEGKEPMRTFLKSEHGLGHFQAQKVAEVYLGIDEYRKENQFADILFQETNSKKIFKKISSQIKKLGKDVEERPCKTYIPFYRKTQFALVKPTKEGLRLCLALPDSYRSKVFSPAKSVGSSRITKQVDIHQVSDIDEAIVKALQVAYKNN